MSSSYRDRCQAKSEAMISSEAPMPRLVHISSTSPLPSVESWKPPALSPGPEVPSPPRLIIQNQARATAPTQTPQEPLSTNKMSLMPQHLERVKSPAEISPASTTDLYKTSKRVLFQKKYLNVLKNLLGKHCFVICYNLLSDNIFKVPLLCFFQYYLSVVCNIAVF